MSILPALPGVALWDSYDSAFPDLSIPYPVHARTRPPTIESFPMLDVILIAIGCGLFFIGIAYAYACDRL